MGSFDQDDEDADGEAGGSPNQDALHRGAGHILQEQDRATAWYDGAQNGEEVLTGNGTCEHSPAYPVENSPECPRSQHQHGDRPGRPESAFGLAQAHGAADASPHQGKQEGQQEITKDRLRAPLGVAARSVPQWLHGVGR